MTRRTSYAAVAVAALALLLPVRGTADLLAGSDPGAPPNLVTGLWLFKALLLVHAGILAVLGRVQLGEEGPRLRRPVAVPEVGHVAERLLVAALLVAAAALRLHDLGDGLWFDEIATLAQHVRLPLGRLISTLDSQNQHVLFSLLARGSVSALGEGASSLRLPAAAFGVASIWAVWWFGRIVAGRREALLAAAFLTFSYHHVWFSQNARGYTGLLFFTLVGSGLFVRLLEAREPSGWGPAVGYAVTMALAVYTHLTAVLVVLAHGLIWLGTAAGRGADPPARRAFVRTGVGLGLAATLSLQLYALVLPQLVGTLTEPTMADVNVVWQNPAWLLAETARGLAAALPGGLVGLAAAGIVGAAGLAGFWRRGRAVTAVLVLPAVATAAAILATGHNLWPRFFFFSAGAAALIVMRGLFVLGALVPGRAGDRRRATIVTWAGVALIAASLPALPGAWRPKQDYDGARAWVEARRRPEDAVATVDMTDLPYRAYLRAGWASIRDAADLDRLEAAHARTWVLYTFPTRLAAVHPDLWRRLEGEYRPAAEFPGTVRGGSIVVLLKERT
ncbi:MAG: glycosyltransferase family 39 protein [Gemmatimonadota bacterium]